MAMRWCSVWVVVSLLPAVLVGCKKKNVETAVNTQGPTITAEDITATRDALARGMREIAVDKLSATQTGRKCVVVAHMPASGYRSSPPPPPPGMVRLMGQTIIYSGEFDGVSADSLTVRAAYPTSGNYKRIDIPTDTIQSCHLAR